MHYSGISINRNFLNESFLNGTIASKSLRFYLHSAKRKKKLHWNQNLCISEDAALQAELSVQAAKNSFLERTRI